MKWRPIIRLCRKYRIPTTIVRLETTTPLTPLETVRQWLKQAIPVKRSRGFLIHGAPQFAATTYCGQAKTVEPMSFNRQEHFLELCGIRESLLGFDDYAGYLLDAEYDIELERNPNCYWDKWLDSLVITFDDFYGHRLEAGK